MNEDVGTPRRPSSRAKDNSEFMSVLRAALLRAIVLGAGLVVYYGVVSLVSPDDDGGADIGAGLLGFVGLLLTSFVWGLLDGRSRGTSTTTFAWAIAAAVLAVGWPVALATTSADKSMSVAEGISADVFSMVFTFGLILVPAVVGAVVGRAFSVKQAA